MIDPKLLAMLRCPVSKTPLAMADTQLIEKLNQSIQGGELRDQLDQKVTEPLQAGLVTEDGSRLYAIRNGIPDMNPDDAIQLA